jgi:hypothetical protein
MISYVSSNVYKDCPSTLKVCLLQASGFQRVRNRKAGVTNRSDDPLGAGLYMFSGVRWLNPDNQQEVQLLTTGLSQLTINFPQLCSTASGDLWHLLEILRRNSIWWEQSAWKLSKRRRSRQIPTKGWMTDVNEFRGQDSAEIHARQSMPVGESDFSLSMKPATTGFQSREIPSLYQPFPSSFLHQNTFNLSKSNSYQVQSEASHPEADISEPESMPTDTVGSSGNPAQTMLPKNRAQTMFSERQFVQVPLEMSAPYHSDHTGAAAQAVEDPRPLSTWRWAWEDCELGPGPAVAAADLRCPSALHSSQPSAIAEPRSRWQWAWEDGELWPTAADAAEGCSPCSFADCIAAQNCSS